MKIKKFAQSTVFMDTITWEINEKYTVNFENNF